MQRCLQALAGGFRVYSLATTWTPKVCKIMDFMAVIMGLGLLFYIPLGFRYRVYLESQLPIIIGNFPLISDCFGLK